MFAKRILTWPAVDVRGGSNAEQGTDDIFKGGCVVLASAGVDGTCFSGGVAAAFCCMVRILQSRHALLALCTASVWRWRGMRRDGLQSARRL